MWDNVSQFLTPVALPFWIIVVIQFVQLWRGYPSFMQRWNERQRDKAAEKAADKQATRDEIRDLRERLNEEIERAERRDKDREEERKAQHEENKKCHSELNVVRAKAGDALAHCAKLQAIIDGLGEVRQAAQIAAAEVRLDDLEAKKREGK